MKKIANFLLIEKDNDIYTINMTPELQDDVGTIGFIQFSETNDIQAGDCILELEASKTIMRVLSPVAGTIIQRNEEASFTPTLLNSEKPEEHWIVRLTDVAPEDFDALEDA